MTVTSPKGPVPTVIARLPQQLVGSTTFLLKRLGYTAKERAMSAYDQLSLHPYHHPHPITLRATGRGVCPGTRSAAPGGVWAVSWTTSRGAGSSSGAATRRTGAGTWSV